MTEPDAVERLERQVERASFFTHTELSRAFTHLDELETFLYGLIDALVAKGTLTDDEVGASAAAVTAEMEETDTRPTLGAALRVDPPDADPPVLVNCSERLHICHAVCCTLDFALNEAEVESGDVKWDLGRPYYIRHEADGYCSHADPETRACCIYEDRPRVCRTYSCAGDGRIWKDFDAMVLNDEWIAEHKGPTRPVLMKLSVRRLAVGLEAGAEEDAALEVAPPPDLEP